MKAKSISRQRAWQIRQRAAGKCMLCGKPASKKSKLYCESHRVAFNALQRARWHRRKFESRMT